MRKILIVLAMLLIVPFNAGAVEITSDPASSTTVVNEIAYFSLNVLNDGEEAESFVISFSGPNPEWISLDTLFFKLGPGESKEVEMQIYPNNNGIFRYDIEVYAPGDEENRDSADVILSVNPPKEVDIRSFEVYRTGDRVEIEAEIFSFEPRDIETLIEVIDGKGNRVRQLSSEEHVEGTETITGSFQVSGLPSGIYTVQISLKDYNIFRDGTFSIEPNHNVVTVKRTNSNPFFEDVVLLVENRGNIDEDYVVRETLPSGQWVTFEDEPQGEMLDEDSQVTYRWSLSGLAVGDSQEIRYRIEYWPGYVAWFVIAIIVLGVIGISVVRMSKPGIRKHYVRKRKTNEHVIVLEVKGSLSRDLKNVMVKDMISPLARVVERFEGPKPMVRVTEAGTELIWRLGDLKARGDILLTYKLKPLVEASLKMPRANLSYRNEDNRKFSVYSSPVIVE